MLPPRLALVIMRDGSVAHRPANQGEMDRMFAPFTYKSYKNGTDGRDKTVISFYAHVGVL